MRVDNTRVDDTRVDDAQVVELLIIDGKEGSSILVEPRVHEEITEAVANGHVDKSILDKISVFSASSQ
eukprot:2358676-Pyramimonas_sp.AAC.1